MTNPNPAPAPALAPAPAPAAEDRAGGPRVGPDGRRRCPWAEAAADYRAYHDEEWGRTVTTVSGLFERLTLEAFQSGLSWLTILRKREAFRRAFAGFDPARVARFTDVDRARLLADADIVRNAAKIDAALGNARVVADLGDDFARLVLGYRQPPRPRPARTGDVPAQTTASVALAGDLKRAGIRFVGPTTAYALMQAVGLVDDHLAGCFVPGPGTAGR